MKIIFSFFLLLFLANQCQCTYLKISTSTQSIVPIDVRTYFLSDAVHEDYNLWVNIDTSTDTHYCTPELDAQYTSFNNNYVIDNWYFKMYDYGVYGGVAISISIVDLELFVAACNFLGVWNDPLDCDQIFNIMESEVIDPVLSTISTDKTFPGLTNANFGLYIEILCKKAGYPDFIEEGSPENFYEACDAASLIELVQMHPRPDLKVLE